MSRTYGRGRTLGCAGAEESMTHPAQVSSDGTDYYRDLQVHPSANDLVVQAAYRALARIFHPDVEGDDAEMKRINAAWEVIGDPLRRAVYDQARAGAHRGPVAGTVATSPRHTGQPATFARSRPVDHAGPPPGRAFGPVLEFGRYDGWSLGEVFTVDRPYLEWLAGVPGGRALRADIAAVLATKHGPGAVDQRRHYEANQRRQDEPKEPSAVRNFASRAAMSLR